MMVFILKRRFRFRRLFLSLIMIDAVYTFFELLTFGFIEGPKCFLHQPQVYQNYQALEDILMASEQPLPGRSIYFLDTRCDGPKISIVNLVKRKIFPASINILNLSARQACAIESAAYHNPSFTVFVLFASPTYVHKNGHRNKVMDALFKYPNIHLRNLNVTSYLADTPTYNWFLEGKIYKTWHIVEHMSDFLRFVTLWRWGGLYLDLDAITLRSMEELPPNYAGIYEDCYIGNSVMNFSPTGIGHQLVTMCLHDLMEKFNGTLWNYNGPQVITRILKIACGTNETGIMINNPKLCKGFKVFDTDAFYAVSWNDWRDYFSQEMLEKTMKTLEPSYITHMWNHITKSQVTRIGSNSVLDILAKRNCPEVYRVIEKYL